MITNLMKYLSTHLFATYNKQPLALLVCSLSLFLAFLVAPAYAQENILEKKIKVNIEQVPLADALAYISDKAGCTFSYSSSSFPADKRVTFTNKELSISNILTEIFGSKLEKLQLQGNKVLIVLKKENGQIKGSVKAKDGQPVEFVNVTIKGLKTVQSSADGSFTFKDIPAGDQVISISGIGTITVSKQVNVKANETTHVTFVANSTIESLREIAVVGQKRKTSSITKMPTELIDIPMSIQVIDQVAMEQRQIIDVRDAVKSVSGVNFAGTYSGGYSRFSGRGFMLENQSGYRRNGMFIWNMGHHFNDNIEQIEVLKGPASFLYGDIAPGAVINFVTKKPLDYKYGKFEMKIGQYGLLRPTVDVSGPLNEKKTILYRLNATYESSRSFVNEVENKTMMFSPSVTWKINPRLEWNVEGTFKNDDRTFEPGIISPDGSFEAVKKLPVGLFLGEPSAKYRYNDVNLFSNLSYNLSAKWKIKNTIYYSNTERISEGMYFPDASAAPNGDANRTAYITSLYWNGYSSNVDLVGKINTSILDFDFVLGADYMMNKEVRPDALMVDYLPINIYKPIYNLTPLMPRNNGYSGMRIPKLFIERYGLYAQTQIKTKNEMLQLLLGLRYNTSSSGTKYTAETPAPEGYKSIKATPLSPRIGLMFKPIDKLSLYGSYSTSYEVNGQDHLTKDVVGVTNSNQFEVGSKTSFLNDKLGIALSLFHINKKDVYGYLNNINQAPSFDYVAYDPVLKMASYKNGHHKSRGIELDITGKITDGFSVNLASSYVDATIVKDPAYQSGNQLEGNSRYTFNSWLNYAFKNKALKGLEVGYGFFYRSSSYGSNSNLPQQLVKAYNSMDASLAYSYKNYSARFNLSNFTNNIGYLGYEGIYEPLYVRRAVLSLSMKF